MRLSTVGLFSVVLVPSGVKYWEVGLRGGVGLRGVPSGVKYCVVGLRGGVARRVRVRRG